MEGLYLKGLELEGAGMGLIVSSEAHRPTGRDEQELCAVARWAYEAAPQTADSAP